MRTLSICFLALLLSCEQGKKTNKQTSTSSKASNIVVTKHDNGKTKAEIPYENGKQHGISKSYGRDGKLILELPYNNGKREGISKKYYAGGKQLYQTTEYKNDKLHGLQVKYRESGNIMSEARFENNLPCIGLKEYLLDNSLKKQYPKINITPIDRLDEKGLYSLEVSMSDKVRSVKYYKGKLTPGGCITDDLYNLLINEKNKTGQLTYHLAPGRFVMEEVNIIAVVETILGNTYITQRSYNVAIDN
jgi:hypothetical protein